MHRSIKKKAVQRACALVAAAALAIGAVDLTSPAATYAASINDFKINNADQAIERAEELLLLPEGAKVTAKFNGAYWELTFKTVEKDFYGNARHTGELAISAVDGELTSFRVKYSLYKYTGDLMQPPYDESKQKISFEEATAIADQFASKQSWQLKDDWIHDRYPVSEYNTRDQEKTVHWVHYDRLHNGYRDDSNHMAILVDRVTGEIASYEVYWTNNVYAVNDALEGESEFITAPAAAKIIINEIKPYLHWAEENGPASKRLAYSLHYRYVLDSKGKFPSLYYADPPKFADKAVPRYPIELAQKRLLSLYDLNREYVPGKNGVLILHYTLRIKPGVPLFYNGVHPSIDANTGEWIDFLSNPIRENLPKVGDWLIDEVAPADKVGYKAAIVWNNELQKLQNEPIIENQYTLVPFRELLTKLEAKINWDPVNRVVTASKDKTTIQLKIDSQNVYINGKKQTLNTPARLAGGRTYIPARLVLETFGAKVKWDGDSRFVIVKTDLSLPELSKEEIKQMRFTAHLQAQEKTTK
ncbi:copper amine oxidase N-terminal domain-containing protein [Paenibacillus sp. IITD108]|uniref:copper amine oxidase N-terminal domain-containing protein n=1 Tax=Paenibacillus sp. IITD108 TaxID=3116649 RepID=UPI002F3F5196